MRAVRGRRHFALIVPLVCAFMAMVMAASVAAADIQASFTYRLQDGYVQFTDTSYGDPVSWRWDFGDDFGSQDQNPKHKYDAGTYVVRLTVTNATGGVSLASTTITVEASADNQLVETEDGWHVFVTDDYTLFVSAAGLMFVGLVMIATAVVGVPVPFITKGGRILLGALGVLAALSFYIFD
jgi:uncharacterized membrane protein